MAKMTPQEIDNIATLLRLMSYIFVMFSAGFGLRYGVGNHKLLILGDVVLAAAFLISGVFYLFYHWVLTLWMTPFLMFWAITHVLGFASIKKMVEKDTYLMRMQEEVKELRNDINSLLKENG